MHDNLLPEAIRGSWYMLADDNKPLAEAIEKKGQLLALRLTGKFSLYDLTQEDAGTAKVEKDEGDYTFDGDFLILRGRNTETYRVRITSAWQWNLEAKKKKRKLLRGNFLPSDFIELDAEEILEIETLAHRVKAESAFLDKDDAIFDLVFSPTDDRRLRIGCFSVDMDEKNHELWIGLTPIATHIGADTWQKIVTQACAMMVRLNPAKIQRVLLEIQGQNVMREFDVSK
ncbi:hypothetical protein [Bradymonas sediminis]|uniref:Uncharacterized protein n=1 Tax=Bradymonas sediminis TaxID=1548548 RepID=A0A2Z4FQE0_9DELT|nr:hypothetical protein [Bradymonas sediminis]AWV91199.1 hypothetical protein DN745_18450 [Bradymonas sediminis]TDP73763.1 hypothetical protein DFR33_10595 [Bradymonas sediminis]